MSSATSPDHTVTGKFAPGNSAYKRAVARKRETHDEIVRELGGAITAADDKLLVKAIDLMWSTPHSHEDRTRALNTANRTLRTLRAKYTQAGSVAASLGEAFANG